MIMFYSDQIKQLDDGLVEKYKKVKLGITNIVHSYLQVNILVVCIDCIKRKGFNIGKHMCGLTETRRMPPSYYLQQVSRYMDGARSET